MARSPYRRVELTEALRPVAAPVDTFVQAQAPSRDTSLQDLARSLSGLGGSLAGMVGERDKKAEEEDAIRGEAAFHANNQQGYAEAVASGAVPAQASQTFMRAYKKAQGEVAGGQMEQEFAAAYDAWPGKTDPNPQALAQFQGQFLKDRLKTDDPDILRGILPKIRQLSANYLQKQIGDASRAQQEGYANALSAKGEQAIDSANSAGLQSRKGTDYGSTFGNLESIREEGLKAGMNSEKIDQKLIDTVTTAAVTKRDPKLLDFLERKVPGKDYTWSQTPYGRDAKQKTIDTLETMGRKSIAEDDRRNREEKAAQKDDVTRRTIQAITKAPNEPIPEDLLAAGEKVDPDFRINAIRWRDTIGKGTQTSDNEQMLAVTTDILNGGGMQRVQQAIRDGVFKNPEDMTKAFKLAESMTKDGVAVDAIMKGGTAKTITDTIKKRSATDKDASKFFDDGSMSNEGLQATADFKQQILAWRQANPTASIIEQEKAVSEIGAGILKRIEQPETMGELGYNREGIPTPNTFDAKAPPKEMPAEAKPAAPAKPPAAAPIDPALYGGVRTDAVGPYGEPLPAVTPEAAPYGGGRPDAVGPYGEPLPAVTPEAAPKTLPAPAAPSQAPDAASWFNELPQETKSAMELRAAQQKKPLSLFAEEVYQRAVRAGAVVPPAKPPGKQTMRAPDGTAIETASAEGPDVQDAPASDEQIAALGAAFEQALGKTGKTQGNYTLATLKDDPKAARILDFVAGPESGGNYNAYFGNAGSTKDLSAMSLAELKGWMGNRGTRSSATGRYQFMKATLFGERGKPGLVQEMGLPMDTKFTPELQDRLALRLLDRRGYQDYLAGRISAAKFGNNLALEWASLPNITPQNGRGAGVSAYDKDGLNKSLVSTSSVLAAIGAGVGPRMATARADMPAPTPVAAPARSLLDRLLGRNKPPAKSTTRV